VPAKPKKPAYPRTVSFENGRVRISLRSDKKFALSWTEGGGLKKTTITDERKALAFAEKKARLINAGTSAEWITPADADALKILKQLAGSGDGSVRRLLDDVRGALHAVGGSHGRLTEAAKFFAQHGALKVEAVTVAQAVERFLGEYKDGETKRTLGNELAILAARHGEISLMDLDFEKLDAYVRRPATDGIVLRTYKRKRGVTRDRNEPASTRTIYNRISAVVTLLNRCRDWSLLPPEGRHAGELLKKPRLPKKGVDIFTVEEGRALLELVRKHEEHRLEAFLLVACWLGLRPTECRRVLVSDFDFERGYLHVRHDVARKLEQERWVPMDERLSARLRWLFSTPAFTMGRSREKVSFVHAREHLSAWARKERIIRDWTPDITRHSFISYRLALTQDIGRVAEEAGNSPDIIRKNYKRPLRPEEGKAWWELLEQK
jgi:integrase